ncbi:MAG TPA: hypothetical protein VJB39_01785 [Patescibacteria group bacterium]|nr:hypothetical protein [Patescibacteria group bacterium]
MKTVYWILILLVAMAFNQSPAMAEPMGPFNQPSTEKLLGLLKQVSHFEQLPVEIELRPKDSAVGNTARQFAYFIGRFETKYVFAKCLDHYPQSISNLYRVWTIYLADAYNADDEAMVIGKCTINQFVLTITQTQYEYKKELELAVLNVNNLSFQY